MLAKLTLVRHGLPSDRTLVRGFGQEPDVLLLRGVPAEISAKRAVQLLGCADFEVEFAEGELDDIDEPTDSDLDSVDDETIEKMMEELTIDALLEEILYG